MRVPWPAVAGGVLVAAVGAAGLIRGAVPQSVAAVPTAPGAVAVTGAYVRAPVPPVQEAAAYFTVYNTTGADDRLQSVQTGAGATAVLHVISHGAMVASPGGVVIPAHGSLVLSTGRGHVMIEQLFGKLTAGQHVSIELQFANAGTITVDAPVIAVGAPAPTAAQGQSSPQPSPSGVHS